MMRAALALLSSETAPKPRSTPINMRSLPASRDNAMCCTKICMCSNHSTLTKQLRFSFDASARDSTS